MLFLGRFLYRNLKGYRFLLVIAILVTITQVGSDLVAAFPLKFIPSKITNPGNDPSCTFPVLNGALSYFDPPVLDLSLRPLQPNQPPLPPPPAPCPASTADQPSVLHPMVPQ